LQRVLPAQKKGPRSLLGDRLFIEAVLFSAKTGLPWRDLPERFGPWKSVYNRFSNWARRRRWEAIFRELQVEVDQTGSIVNGSVIPAHQDASGGKGGSNPMLWVALASFFSTKLHAIVDTKARPLYITLTPGQRHEMVAACKVGCAWRWLS
jgi:transposase